MTDSVESFIAKMDALLKVFPGEGAPTRKDPMVTPGAPSPAFQDAMAHPLPGAAPAPAPGLTNLPAQNAAAMDAKLAPMAPTKPAAPAIDMIGGGSMPAGPVKGPGITPGPAKLPAPVTTTAPGQPPAPAAPQAINVHVGGQQGGPGVKDVADTMTGGAALKQPLKDAASRATGTNMAVPPAPKLPKVNVQPGAAKPAAKPAPAPGPKPVPTSAPMKPGAPTPGPKPQAKGPPAAQASPAPVVGKAITKSKEEPNMTTDIAKSIADMGELFKANVDALKALNGRLGAIEARVTDLSKEMPPKDGTKAEKDTDHDATTEAQETQVHEATPEAAVKTFKPDNKIEGAFAPKMKAAPVAPKTVSFQDAVAKAVAAEMAKRAPAVSTTPAPAGLPAGTSGTGKPWLDTLNKCIDNDRKLHGIYMKSADPNAATGFRPGDESVKVSSTRFMRKALRGEI